LTTDAVCRFQEIAGAIETALYTPFAQATGLFFASVCLLLVIDVVSLFNIKVYTNLGMGVVVLA